MSVKAAITDIKDITNDCESLGTSVMALGEIIASGNIFTITIKLTTNILFNGFDIYDELHKMSH